MRLRVPIEALRWSLVALNVGLVSSAGYTSYQFFTERPDEITDLVLQDPSSFSVPEEKRRRQSDRFTSLTVGMIDRRPPPPAPIKSVTQEKPPENLPTALGGPLATEGWTVDGMMQVDEARAFAYLLKDTGETAPTPTPRTARRRRRRRVTPVSRAGAAGPTTKVAVWSGQFFTVQDVEYFCELVDAQSGSVRYRQASAPQVYVLTRPDEEGQLDEAGGGLVLRGSEVEETDDKPGALKTPVDPNARRGSIGTKSQSRISNGNADAARRRQSRAASERSTRVSRQRAELARRQVERQRASLSAEQRAAIDQLKEQGVSGEEYERMRQAIERGEVKGGKEGRGKAGGAEARKRAAAKRAQGSSKPTDGAAPKKRPSP